MRNLGHAGRVVVLSSLVVLGLVVGVSAPAWAGNVTACGDFSASPDTRFDIQNNLNYAANTGACLIFPDNAVVVMNGFALIGTNIDNDTTGIQLGDNSFLWGPGILRGFGVCVAAGDHVAVEGIVTNWCGTGIEAGDSYKIKEVRVHDCLPSNGPGIGIHLEKTVLRRGSQGGFIESTIVRNCDNGVETGENNKIWNLVVTNHEFVGLIVSTGNAVSRTVISHPRSSGTIGLQYECFSGGGCQDGSNSVDGHQLGNNIQIFGGSGQVVTQPQEDPAHGATNCNGFPVSRDNVTGRINASC